MTARERWQALQTTLAAARSAVGCGDKVAALAAVNAALELDPNFLAAQSLRDRIVAGDMPTPIETAPPHAVVTEIAPPACITKTAPHAVVTETAPHAVVTEIAPPVFITETAPPAVITETAPHAVVTEIAPPAFITETAASSIASAATTTHSLASGEIAAPHPIVSTEGYAKFEQRARRRRVDRRIEAARQAIEKKRLKQAAAALDEVIELDPNLPELSELTVQFDQLRRSAEATHRGPWFAAALVFAVTVFTASWLQESSPLFSRSMIAATPLLAAPTSSVLTDFEPVATTGVTEPAQTVTVPRLTTVVPPSAPAPAPYTVTAAVLHPSVEPVAELAAPPPPPAPPVPQPTPIAIAPPRPVQESPVAAAVTLPVPPKIEEADEHALVRQALQRYRSAYEDLDAKSAHSVWPAVNQVALARAFDGLESQSLTFNACDVRVHGEAATATCQGSARYVPKIGSRQPRIEARVWNFTLHKAGTDWKIDSARAER